MPRDDGSDREPVPAWQRLLLPEHPGLPQFLFGLIALLLPMLGLHNEHGIDPRQLVLSVSIGCALGVSWTWLLGRAWWRKAPINTVCVLAMCFGTLVNLDVMPRWDALVRAQVAMDFLRSYVADRAAGREVPMRAYDTGDGQARFVVRTGADGRLLAIYTPESDPIMRWTPIGWRPGCFVVMRGDGNGQVLRNPEALNDALAGIPAGAPAGAVPAPADAGIPATAPSAAEAGPATAPASATGPAPAAGPAPAVGPAAPVR